MNAANFSIDALLQMRHSPIRNYAIPGVTSWLIGQPSKHGTMRLFESQRQHEEPIAPHSHRFNFQSWVLRGSVRNVLWVESPFSDADQYAETELVYGGIGIYEKGAKSIGRFIRTEQVYREGDCYAMQAEEIHSIYFGRGALVLFFEGPTVSDRSVVLEPYVDQEVVPTFSVQPWMFQRGKVL